MKNEAPSGALFYFDAITFRNDTPIGYNGKICFNLYTCI